MDVLIEKPGTSIVLPAIVFIQIFTCDVKKIGKESEIQEKTTDATGTTEIPSKFKNLQNITFGGY